MTVDRIIIEKNTKDIYENISIFKNLKWIPRFLITMSLGFSMDKRTPIEIKEPIVLKQFLKSEEFALIQSIAIKNYDNNVQILNDEEKVFKAAEEYANTGIKILKDMEDRNQLGSFLKNFEKLILDEIDQLEI